MEKRYASLLLINILLLLFVSFNPSYSQNNVLLQTNYGDITIILYEETAQHKNNFIKLVQQGFYDGLLFHRVISNFMIQTGDPNSKNAQPGQVLGTSSLSYTIPAEFFRSYIHKKGALAAARKPDAVNPNKESSSSQFYLVQGIVYTLAQLKALENSSKHLPFTPEEIEIYTTIGGTPHLDNSYTVFGEVTDGLDIISKIASVSTDSRNRPLTDVKIIKATIIY
jgi:cyclophilin family peptidyl-prolyl cis-trans isomerase